MFFFLCVTNLFLSSETDNMTIFIIIAKVMSTLRLRYLFIFLPNSDIGNGIFENIFEINSFSCRNNCFTAFSLNGFDIFNCMFFSTHACNYFLLLLVPECKRLTIVNYRHVFHALKERRLEITA